MNAEQFAKLVGKLREEWAERTGHYTDLIPDYTMESLQGYLLEGIPTGHFLQAVMDNDLFGAVGRADENNLKALPHIVRLIHNHFPCCARNREEWLEMFHVQDALGNLTA